MSKRLSKCAYMCACVFVYKCLCEREERKTGGIILASDSMYACKRLSLNQSLCLVVCICVDFCMCTNTHTHMCVCLCVYVLVSVMYAAEATVTHWLDPLYLSQQCSINFLAPTFKLRRV